MNVVIIGAGGHGKVVLDILRADRHTKIRPVGFLDANPALIGTMVGGLPVLGNIHHLPKLQRLRIGGAIVAIGDNALRQQYAQTLLADGIELINAIHPAAIVSPSASIGRNVVIAPGAIVSAEARIGDSTILNSGCIVEHECEIGEAVHVCPSAVLSGRVRAECGAFIGTGAKVIPCLTIGAWAILGAGAVVIRDVPEGATVVGVPAEVIKSRTMRVEAA